MRMGRGLVRKSENRTTRRKEERYNRIERGLFLGIDVMRLLFIFGDPCLLRITCSGLGNMRCLKFTRYQSRIFPAKPESPNVVEVDGEAAQLACLRHNFIYRRSLIWKPSQ